MIYCQTPDDSIQVLVESVQAVPSLWKKSVKLRCTLERTVNKALHHISNLMNNLKQIRIKSRYYISTRLIRSQN